MVCLLLQHIFYYMASVDLLNFSLFYFLYFILCTAPEMEVLYSWLGVMIPNMIISGSCLEVLCIKSSQSGESWLQRRGRS